jgi:hypothetical protein
MSTADPDQKRDYCTVDADPSLAAPAVRMVLVAAVCRGEVASYQIYPVLAIQAFNRHKYSRVADGHDVRDLMPPPSVAAAEEYGWEWEWSEIDHDYLIYDEYYGFGPASLPLNCENAEWEVFVAD